MTINKQAISTKKTVYTGIVVLLLLGIGVAWQQFTKTPLIAKDDPKWLVDYITAIQNHKPKTREEYTEFASDLNAAVAGLDVASLPIYHQLHVLFARGLALSICAGNQDSVKCMRRARATVAKIHSLLQSPRLSKEDHERLNKIQFDRSVNALYSGLNNIQQRWANEQPALLKRLEIHLPQTKAVTRSDKAKQAHLATIHSLNK